MRTSSSLLWGFVNLVFGIRCNYCLFLFDLFFSCHYILFFFLLDFRKHIGSLFQLYKYLQYFQQSFAFLDCNILEIKADPQIASLEYWMVIIIIYVRLLKFGVRSFISYFTFPVIEIRNKVKLNERFRD